MAKMKDSTKKSTAAPATSEKKKSTENPGTGGSWFSQGQDGFERKHKLDEIAKMRKERFAPRFYLKNTPGNHEEGEGKDNEARLVFLDSVGFWVHEHNLKVEGKWGNYATCTKDFRPCEVCNQLNDKPVFTCYFTVIDTRRFTRQDGTVSKNRKVMFPAKGAAIDVLENLRKKHGDLRGLVIDVKRIGDRDPNCGRDFDVVTKDGRVVRIDPAKKFEGELSVPYDYKVILKPLETPEQFKAIGVTVSPVVGSDDDIGDDDEAPKGRGKASTVADDDDEVESLLGD